MKEKGYNPPEPIEPTYEIEGDETQGYTLSCLLYERKTKNSSLKLSDYKVYKKPKLAHLFNIPFTEKQYNANFVMECCLYNPENKVFDNDPCLLFYQPALPKDALKNWSNYFALKLKGDKSLWIYNGIGCVHSDVNYSGVLVNKTKKILFSAYRHDYQVDEVDDDWYMVDGGREYGRHSLNGDIINFKIEEGKLVYVPKERH